MHTLIPPCEESAERSTETPCWQSPDPPRERWPGQREHYRHQCSNHPRRPPHLGQRASAPRLIEGGIHRGVGLAASQPLAGSQRSGGGGGSTHAPTTALRVAVYSMHIRAISTAVKYTMRICTCTSSSSSGTNLVAVVAVVLSSSTTTLRILARSSSSSSTTAVVAVVSSSSTTAIVAVVSARQGPLLCCASDAPT